MVEKTGFKPRKDRDDLGILAGSPLVLNALPYSTFPSCFGVWQRPQQRRDASVLLVQLFPVGSLNSRRINSRPDHRSDTAHPDLKLPQTGVPPLC